MAVFLLGAVVALALAQHKFRHRQVQLEKQFFARQQSGHTVPMDRHRFTDEKTDTMITLEPLLWLIMVIAMVSSSWFWWTRWSLRRHARKREGLH